MATEFGSWGASTTGWGASTAGGYEVAPSKVMKAEEEPKPKNRLAHLKVDVRRCLCSENLWN